MTNSQHFEYNHLNNLEGKSLSAIDLFCGVGGLTHGFLKEGIDVIAGYDIEESCKYPYESNNDAEFIYKPIEKTSSLEILKKYPDKSIKILMGCAPCQPFSSYNRYKSGNNKMNLLEHFSRIIEGVHPEIVTMENVPRLRNYKVFDDFIESLKRMKYNVDINVVRCEEYGIPQIRRRLVLLASRLGEITLIKGENNPENFKTVREAIGDVEPIEAGEISKNDPLHRTRNLSAKNFERIKITPEGGSWVDWPDEYKNSCHMRETGKSFSSIYGRMRWDEPSPTITTQFMGYGNGRFGHPEQNRALSFREGALLQTFPKNYHMVDPNEEFSGTKIAKYIGNAVPVELARVIAKSIKKHRYEKI